MKRYDSEKHDLQGKVSEIMFVWSRKEEVQAGQSGFPSMRRRLF